MIKKISDAIPSKSVSYLIIFGGIIIIVILIGVIPFHRYNANRNQEVESIQSQIAEQKEFQQIYKSLKNIAGTERVHKLPNPQKAKLPRLDVDKFQDVFRAEAKKSGLLTTSLMPDMKTITTGSSAILFNATTTGEFANFRELLLNLGALPYIDTIEEINIKQHEDAMEFKLKIWVALAN